MTIRDRLKRFFSPGTPSTHSTGGISLWRQSIAGPPVTAESAIRHTPVYSAVSVLSRDLAALSLPVYRRLIGGGKVLAPEHRSYRLLHDYPNEEVTSFQFRRTIWAHMYLAGNGYGEIVRDWAGNPTSLVTLCPFSTRPTRIDGGRIIYETKDIDGRKRFLLPENVLHISDLSFDGFSGASRVALASETIGLGIALQEYASAFFGNGATVGGWITTDKDFKNEEAENRYREQVNSLHQGSENAFRIGFLKAGMGFTPNGIDPDKSQVVGQRQFQVLETARIFGLPPHKLGDYSQSHLANLEESNQDYLQTSLLPNLIAFEAECNRKLFFEDERSTYFCEHNMDSFLRANSTARSTFYHNGLQDGWLTRNEVRVKENLNPLPGGDSLLQPLNMGVAAPSDVEPEDPSEEPVSTAPDPAVVEPVKSILLNEIRRAVRRETQALRRSGSKYDSYREWLGDFYAKHASDLEKAVTPALTIYASVTGQARNAKAVIASLGEHRDEVEGLYLSCSPEEFAEAVERKCDLWEKDTAEQFLQILLEGK